MYVCTHVCTIVSWVLETRLGGCVDDDDDDDGVKNDMVKWRMCEQRRSNETEETARKMWREK